MAARAHLLTHHFQILYYLPSFRGSNSGPRHAPSLMSGENRSNIDLDTPVSGAEVSQPTAMHVRSNITKLYGSFLAVFYLNYISLAIILLLLDLCHIPPGVKVPKCVLYGTEANESVLNHLKLRQQINNIS
jgi:hypothetical protein